jgi:hypothetical protein
LPSVYVPVPSKSPQEKLALLLGRFESKFVKADGCWLWHGAIDRWARGGYGRFGYMGRNDKAHRVAWILYKGPIPDGLHVLHTCDVRSCVNPNHLWLGTNDDNILDKAKKHRGGVIGEKNPHSRLTADKVREHGHAAHKPAHGADPGTPHERLNRLHAQPGRPEGAMAGGPNGAAMAPEPMAPNPGMAPPGIGAPAPSMGAGPSTDTEEGDQS